jgi:dihydrofolate reductase
MENDTDRSRRGRNPKNEAAAGQGHVTVGGATTVSSLMNLGLIDELRLLVNPLILGGGKALLKDVKGRHALKLVSAKALNSGKVSLTYSKQTEKV